MVTTQAPRVMWRKDTDLVPLAIQQDEDRWSISRVITRTYSNKESKRPLGRYDFAVEKRRPGTFTVCLGRFPKKVISDVLAPRSDTLKQQKSTRLSHAHGNSLGGFFD